MSKVVRVQFEKAGSSYYFLANNFLLNPEDYVLVNTERGIQFGQVITDIIEIDETVLTSPLKDVVCKATNKDYDIWTRNIKDALVAKQVAKELAIKYKLKISIIDAAYTFDRDQLVFHFVSDSRVDFRELARSLASKYRTRIELRQVGVRDKAKQVGGIGSCGQKLCCNRFLKEFDSVSINMAKNQNIALNPTKINGSCGRLLCCLKYENDNYSENKRSLPRYGEEVTVDGKKGTVVGINVLKNNYTVDIPKVGQVVKDNN